MYREWIDRFINSCMNFDKYRANKVYIRKIHTRNTRRYDVYNITLRYVSGRDSRRSLVLFVQKIIYARFSRHA